MLLSDCYQIVNHYHPEVAKEVYVFLLFLMNFLVCSRCWLRRWEFLNHLILVSVQVLRIYCVSNQILNHFLFHDFSLGLKFSFSLIIIMLKVVLHFGRKLITGLQLLSSTVTENLWV